MKLLGLAYLNKPSLVAEKSEPLVILRSAFWEENVACSSLISLCEVAVLHYGLKKLTILQTVLILFLTITQKT